MKGRKILLAFIISAVTLTSGCANGTPKTEEAKSEQKTTEENAVVPIKPITEKAIDDNPYMAKSDARRRSCLGRWMFTISDKQISYVYR